MSDPTKMLRKQVERLTVFAENIREWARPEHVLTFDDGDVSVQAAAVAALLAARSP